MDYAIITGASKGIGKAIAEELARRNYNLILIARSEELLNKLSVQLSADYSIDARYLVADLGKPDATAHLSDAINRMNLPTSILVNNAGYGLWGYFDRIPIESQINMIQVNATALVELTYRLMPSLKAHQSAYILNVSSTTAYQPVPTLSVYAATKSFVLSFSHGLRHELKGTGVSVTCLSPGSTDTNFMDRAGMDAEDLRKMAKKFGMQPQEVAKIAVTQMFKGRPEVIPGALNSISSKLSGLLPSTISAKTAAGLYEKHLK